MLTDGGTAAWNTSWKRSHVKLPGAPVLIWIKAAALRLKPRLHAQVTRGQATTPVPPLTWPDEENSSGFLHPACRNMSPKRVPSAHSRARGPRFLGSVSSITDAARSQARAISKNVARSVSSLVLRANWMHSRACPLYFCDKVIERPSAHDFPICRIAKVKKPSVNPRGNATTVPMKRLAMSESPNRNHPPAAPMLASGLGS